MVVNDCIFPDQTATMEVAAVVAELGTAKTAATTRAGTTRAKVAGARTTETPATEAAMGAVRCEEVITIPTVVADHTEVSPAGLVALTPFSLHFSRNN